MSSTQEGYMSFVMDLDEKINMKEHIFVYDGFVDQELTKFFANKVNAILENTGVDFLVVKRIYHIMI